MAPVLGLRKAQHQIASAGSRQRRVWNESRRRKRDKAAGVYSEEQCQELAQGRFEVKYTANKTLYIRNKTEVVGIKCKVDRATRFDGKTFIIKTIPGRPSHMVGNGVSPCPSEIHVMNDLRRRKDFVQMKEYFILPDNMYSIVMEDAGDDWKDLKAHIQSVKGLINEDDAMIITKNIIKAVDKLHRVGYRHNDIKEANILVNINTLKIKLIDFGSTSLFDKTPIPCSKFRGTPTHKAPEINRSSQTTVDPEKAEVWALGTIFCKLLLNIDCSMRLNKDGTIQYATAEMIEEACDNVICSVEARSCLQKMLEHDPQKRISFDDAMRLPIFSSHRKKPEEVPIVELPTASLKRNRKDSKFDDDDDDGETNINVSTFRSKKVKTSKPDCTIPKVNSPVPVSDKVASQLPKAPQQLPALPSTCKGGKEKSVDEDKEEEDVIIILPSPESTAATHSIYSSTTNSRKRKSADDDADEEDVIASRPVKTAK
ncbi:hypothetical protein HDU76_010136 [Blyttiomyces sp. JEL0837]|nr:hypothetical protein HDU76_010136 [Blyttiomyces sp. JEL0837]